MLRQWCLSLSALFPLHDCREQEAALKDALDSHAQKDNLWESVVELVDLKAKEDASDISRMRQTMLAMKNE